MNTWLAYFSPVLYLQSESFTYFNLFYHATVECARDIDLFPDS